MRLLLRVLATLLVLLSAAWAVLALHYRLPLAAPWPLLAGLAWALAALAAIVLLWRGAAARGLPGYGIAFALLLGWWVGIPPSDTRDWAPDVARHLQAQVDGSVVRLANVRDFDWRSDRLHAALADAHVRPRPAALGGRGAVLLDGPGHRPYAGFLRF